MPEPPLKNKSLYFIGPGHVEIREEPMPELAAVHLLVETVLSGISAGTEMLLYRGQMPVGQAVDANIPSLQGNLDYPLKYGYAAVGRVLESPGLDGMPAPGAFIFSFQPHQTHFAVEARDVILLPEDIPPADAVFLPNMETALGFVMDGAPVAGERVAVLGQGVVGILTTAVLSAFPLENLTCFDFFPIRREASLAFGAGEALAQIDDRPDLLHSFDLVYELSGSPKALDTAIALAGEEGRIVVGSWYGGKKVEVDLGGHFHRGRLRLISSQVSRLAPKLGGRWTKARRMAFAMEMLRRIRPSRLITHTFPFEDAAGAYRLIDQHSDETIQVVLRY